MVEKTQELAGHIVLRRLYAVGCLKGIPPAYAGMAEDCVGRVLLLCSEFGKIYSRRKYKYRWRNEIINFNKREEIITLTSQ